MMVLANQTEDTIIRLAGSSLKTIEELNIKHDSGSISSEDRE
jgi:hypothetical protein